jgi:hypothetical protein
MATPVTSGKFRAVMLSPERYRNRRYRFYKSLRDSGGFLMNGEGVRWHVGKDWRDRFPPQGHYYRQVNKRPHYWAATCDHLDIIEQALAQGVDTLLVLEDDARFPPGFEEAFEHAVALLPDGWRALQLNWNSREKTGYLLGPLAGPAGRGAGMLANLWSREGLLRFYGHAMASRHRIIDACYDHLRALEPDGFFRPSGQLLEQDNEGVGLGCDS